MFDFIYALNFLFVFSSLQKLELAYDKLSNDHEKLKKEETDKSSRLQEMT